MNGNRLLSLVALLALSYAGTYLLLSLQGRYEPAVISPTYVKSHAWAPKGFFGTRGWRTGPRLIFIPLYLCDVYLWHTAEAAYPERYPINRPN